MKSASSMLALCAVLVCCFVGDASARDGQPRGNSGAGNRPSHQPRPQPPRPQPRPQPPVVVTPRPQPPRPLPQPPVVVKPRPQPPRPQPQPPVVVTPRPQPPRPQPQPPVVVTPRPQPPRPQPQPPVVVIPRPQPPRPQPQPPVVVTPRPQPPRPQPQPPVVVTPRPQPPVVDRNHWHSRLPSPPAKVHHPVRVDHRHKCPTVVPLPQPPRWDRNSYCVPTTYRGRYHLGNNCDFYRGYYHQRTWFDRNFFAYRNYCPTPFVYHVGAGYWWNSDFGYSWVRPDCHEPITVVVVEKVDVPVWDPVTGQWLNEQEEMTWYYNAYWDRGLGCYVYQDRHGCYHTLRW